MNIWPLLKTAQDIRFWARSKCEHFLWRREMGGRESLVRPRIFGITYPYLGDTWVGLSHLVRFRNYSNQPHLLRLESIGEITSRDRESLIAEISSLLGIEKSISLTDCRAELPLPVHPARNGAALLSPKVKQYGRKYVAYQFDGVSQPQLNPSEKEIEEFLGLFDASCLRRIGKPLTLAESMEILLQSKLFLGVSSGMSHLAASAATTSLIYNKGDSFRDGRRLKVYRHLLRWHPYPNARLFSDVKSLAALLHKQVNRDASAENSDFTNAY